MYAAFNGALSFNQNIGSWNMAKVNNVSLMLSGVTLSPTNYNALLTGWAAQTLKPSLTLNAPNVEV